MSKRDLYQEITNKIIEQLEGGNIPWLKPWKDGKNADPSMPYNAATGRAYNGVNVLILWSTNFESNGWLTYKQAQSLGGNIKKGQKGQTVTFWKFFKKTDKLTNEETSFPMLRAYTVFNVEQCENLENLPQVKPIITEATTALELALTNGATVKHHGNEAFFSPSSDCITMPPQSNFNSIDNYESILLHELTHWTGHHNRLDRDFSGRYGSESYAFEELIAEMGSAFLCASFGVTECISKNASYIKSWLKVLKSDKRAIFTASSQSKKATEYLIENNQTIKQAA